MKIISTFVPIIPDSLIAVQFVGEESDEFALLFDKWSDVSYLRTFFKDNQDILNNDFWDGIEINEAVKHYIR